VNKISKKKIKIVGFFIFFRLYFINYKYIIFFMLCHTTDVKVRYGETDQMGVVYHGNYAQYFEIGRTDWLSALGFSYKSMELEGLMLPVVILNINYCKSAFYDDILTIKTTLIKMPKVSIEFDYEIKNAQGELITTAYSKLVFVDAKTRLPRQCPQIFLDQLHN
jgi:acyl-CoA thioester hydrolase